MEHLYDISEVCTMLGTTSRTLRFYEAKHLIGSTVTPPSARRKYSEAQLDTIKKVLALRALGLPLKTIGELAQNQTSLREAVLLHRAKLYAMIQAKQKEINLLEEVLYNMDAAPVSDAQLADGIVCTEEQLAIAQICTDAILEGKYGVLVEYYSEDMKILMPEPAIAHAVKQQTEPLGAFIARDAAFRPECAPNIVICPLRYEKMIYRLKYVFHGNTLCGFWSDYVHDAEVSYEKY